MAQRDGRVVGRRKLGGKGVHANRNCRRFALYVDEFWNADRTQGRAEPPAAEHRGGSAQCGKSTLFNKLTRSRDALVADVPGLTRDRRYGRMEFEGGTATLIDTGGLFGDDVLSDALTQQTRLAVNEADIVLLMFDGRDGVTAADEDVVDYLRKSMWRSFR